VIISAGFKEVGGEGAQLEQALRKRVRELGLRVVGPNCLGIIDTQSRINATFAAGTPTPGHIAFFSQSGALCTAILDWAIGNGVGFSKFISLDNKADCSEVDFIEALADDPETRVILGYIEGVEDGRRFMAAAERAGRVKPLIMMKAGGTPAGARAASSHTGTLAGSEKAFAAAFRQAGILRAESVEELFDWARAFAYQPLPDGPHLAILTNAGGPGIIAADAAERLGVPLAPLAPATVERLRAALPPTAALYNPVDVIGDADAPRYRTAVEAVTADPEVHGVLCLSTPQAMTDLGQVAEAVGEAAKGAGKPVFTAFMGEASLPKARAILRRYGIPQYPYPEPAVRAFHAMVRYRTWREREPAPVRRIEADLGAVARRILEARRQDRHDLGEAEARQAIAAYGFRLPASVVARTVEEAVAAAEQIGFPVVLKIVSPEILHKTDVGGVRLNLRGADDVARAFAGIDASVRRFFPHAAIHGIAVQEQVAGGKEVILGMTRDPQFGPLVMLGLGGIYVEVLKDVAFRVAPFGPDEAEAMIREIRAFPLLRGVRGEKPSDLAAVVDALCRLSQLATDFPEILEMDINPLLVRPEGEGAVAIDCRLSIGD
jgi:acetyltransferase